MCNNIAELVCRKFDSNCFELLVYSHRLNVNDYLWLMTRSFVVELYPSPQVYSSHLKSVVNGSPWIHYGLKFLPCVSIPVRYESS